MSLKWQEGALDDAVALAKAAAPYLHARAVAGRACGDISALKDHELDEIFGPGAERTASAPETAE